MTDWDAPIGDLKVYKFTPGGARTTFASRLNGPVSLAFDSAGNIFVGDEDQFNGLPNTIYKFTPSGVRSTFASGLAGFLAFRKPTARPATDFNNDGSPDLLLF